MRDRGRVRTSLLAALVAVSLTAPSGWALVLGTGLAMARIGTIAAAVGSAFGLLLGAAGVVSWWGRPRARAAPPAVR